MTNLLSVNGFAGVGWLPACMLNQTGRASEYRQTGILLMPLAANNDRADLGLDGWMLGYPGNELL